LVNIGGHIGQCFHAMCFHLKFIGLKKQEEIFL